MGTILVIEDDTSIAEIYRIAFTRRNHPVEIASDGEEGINKARTLKPALILLDVMMRKKDGLQVITDLKANPETKDIPVFIISNLSNPSIQKKMLDSGALKFLVKSDYLPDQVVDIAEKFFNPQAHV